MSHQKPSHVPGFAVAAFLCCHISPLLAQSLGLTFGVSRYHLMSQGSGFLADPYLRVSIGKPLFLVFSLPVLQKVNSVDYGGIRANTETRLLFPEARLEASVKGHPLSPFVGVGLGAGISVSGHEFGGATLNASGGVRARIKERLLAIAAVEFRSVKPWHGSTTDYLIGVELPLSRNK